MDDKFLFGLALGMLGGAGIATNSLKARNSGKQGQEQVIAKVSEMQGDKKKKQD